LDKTAELLTVARQPMICTWFLFNHLPAGYVANWQVNLIYVKVKM